MLILHCRWEEGRRVSETFALVVLQLIAKGLSTINGNFREIGAQGAYRSSRFGAKAKGRDLSFTFKEKGKRILSLLSNVTLDASFVFNYRLRGQ